VKTDTLVAFKAYTSAFAIDPPKLTRIGSIVESRMAEVKATAKPRYLVRLQDGRRLEFGSLEDLTAYDNTAKNPVIALTLFYHDGLDDTLHSVEFDLDSDIPHNVHLAVTGTSTKWSNETLAELDEQVERTFQHSWVHRYLKSRFVFLFSPFLALMFIIILIVARLMSFGISHSEFSALRQRASVAQTTEQKIDYIFEATRVATNGVAALDFGALLGPLFTARVLFLILPIAIVLLGGAYTIATCYPRAAFLWGDYADHYKHLMSRKKTVWLTVIAALVLGILGNLFAAALSRVF
jgi:hypothetical protein